MFVNNHHGLRSSKFLQKNLYISAIYGWLFIRGLTQNVILCNQKAKSQNQ